MVEHMNSDHAKAIAHYVELAACRKPCRRNGGIDSEGMHLRIGQALHWLPFQRLVIRRHKCAKPWFLWLTPRSGQKCGADA
jgi:putative heme iron utilization protein